MLICLQMIESEEDRDKFEQLYNHYKNQMFYVANQILHNEHDAEDAVHQAFVALLKNLEKISDVKCPRTRAYVVITVERKALDIIRHRRRFAGELDETRSGMEFPMPDDGGVADALARLPARYRAVLLLRFDCGYSTGELAELLEMNRGSVQKLVWRAREALARQMEGDE